jgi:hypothetical protein
MIDDKTPPEDHAHRIVRAEDVSTLRAVTQLGRMFNVWLAVISAVIVGAFVFGFRYANLPTKNEIVEQAAFDAHVSYEQKRWDTLNPQLVNLSTAINELSTQTALLKQRLDDAKGSTK